MMKGRKRFLLLMIFALAVIAGIVPGVFAQEEGDVGGGHTIAPGIDIWTTPPGNSHQDFSDSPIPADFFGPGSDPFDGIISLVGAPGRIPGYPAEVDTVVQRLDQMDLPGPGSSAQTEIEIVALHLRSESPIVVTYGGTGQKFFDVEVRLSDNPPLLEPGLMLVSQNDDFGGVFDSVLPVVPHFTFIEVGGSGEPIEMDLGPLGGVIFLQGAGTPFIFDGFCPIRVQLPGITSPNFSPGYTWNELNNRCFCELSSEEAQLAAHGVLPARFAGEPDEDGDGIPDVCDNCPLTRNTDQTDLDGNLIGDACEATGSVIPPGSDLWVTPRGLSWQDFGPIPLPIPGFPDFDGLMIFEGVPLDANNFGPADTIVNRLQEANLSSGGATVDIEIVALSLSATEPIEVADSFFDVFVELSAAPQQTGSLTIRQEAPEGGTFDAILPVIPKFTLTPLGDGDIIIIDGGLLDPPMVIDLGSTGHPWAIGGAPCAGRVEILGVIPPAMPTSSNFAVGHLIHQVTNKCHCLLTSEESQLAAHGVYPARWNNLADSDNDEIPDECDNCYRIPNTDQADADVDLIGNVCEHCDFNSDNVWDRTDWNLRLQRWLGTGSGDPADTNSSGSVDILDFIASEACIPRDC